MRAALKTRTIEAACLLLGCQAAWVATGCGAAEPVAAGPPPPLADERSRTPPPPTTPEPGTEVAPPAEAPRAAAPARPSEPLNVILILVDSLRADMPWAGYPRPIAPNLTELAKESTRYTRGFSISSVTAKSVGGLLAARYPSTLRRNGFFDTTYSRDNVFFPELLAQAGVHSLAAHAHTYMGGPGNKGLAQGFEEWQLVKGLTYDMVRDRDVTSHKITPLAVELLSKLGGGERFFLYLHYMDPHAEYVPHREAPDLGTKARDVYDQEVFYTDLWIGKFLEHARAQPWWKNTALIVSADHGEAFGEHRMYRHAFELWHALTHVPLIVHVPGGVARPIETPRGHIDLGPTILDLMGVAVPADLPGRSLVPELYGADPEPRPVLLDLPADNSNPERRALIRGDDKLLVFGSDQRFDLYDLASDPGETKNLASTQPEKLAEMKALYAETWGKQKRIKPL